MRTALILTITMLAGVTAQGGGRPLETQTTVTVYKLIGMPTSNYTVERAQSIANRIFSEIGVRLAWRTGAPHRVRGQASQGELSRDTIVVQIDAEAAGRFAPDVLAYATPSTTSGTCIHVFYDRVRRRGGFQPKFQAVVLGHVLAHEIAHILGVSRHSPDGLMKAVWTEADYDAMVSELLVFAAVDRDLIGRHLAGGGERTVEYAACAAGSRCPGAR